jgi:flavin reductase (DIM6/NTAB) family NADH-FMN oxidoreductase RutF
MSFDSRALRNALGRFATGVTVISTMSPDQRAIGMTANSFSSVSLDPPLVLWSLQNNSDVYPLFSEPAYFAINILSQQQLALSNRYARKDEHELSAEHYRIGRYGSPILRGAIASFECKLEATHDGGDHRIIVGRVRDFAESPTGEPLLFYAGAYRDLH